MLKILLAMLVEFFRVKSDTCFIKNTRFLDN